MITRGTRLPPSRGLGLLVSMQEQQEVLTTLKWMLKQLNENRLEVALMDAPDARHREHKVRRAITSNPIWYKTLCAKCPRRDNGHYTQPRTRLHREGVTRVLVTLISGRKTHSYLAEELVELARDIVEAWDVERDAICFSQGDSV